MRETQHYGTLTVCAGLVLATCGCLEPPVSERIEIELAGKDATTVRTEIRLKPSAEVEGRARDRVARMAREIAEESDGWSRRLRVLEPAEDRYQIDRVRGEVVSARRAARLERRELLETLFAGTPVGARYAEGQDWQELTLLPDRTGPATMSERRKTDAEIESWAERAADYYGAAAELWEYVASHPDRARPCFESLFLTEASDSETNEEEAQLVERLEDGIGGVLAMLSTDPGEEYTLSERVRRAYDPFPAAIKLTIPGAPLEVEGFAKTADGALAIDALDLWNAFRSLNGKWLKPDPAVALWQHEIAATGQPFDLEQFLSQPRWSARPPRASDVVAAMRVALEPAAVYRVRWRLPDEGEPRPDAAR